MPPQSSLPQPHLDGFGHERPNCKRRERHSATAVRHRRFARRPWGAHCSSRVPGETPQVFERCDSVDGSLVEAAHVRQKGAHERCEVRGGRRAVGARLLALRVGVKYLVGVDIAQSGGH